MVAEIVTMIILSVSSNAIESEQGVQKKDEFDISIVSDITAEELHQYAPYWCSYENCKDIVELSQEYGIASEFALTVFRYEYVPDRNSVGGWTNDAGEYIVYENVSESIEKWFFNMSKTYMDEESHHYSLTGGTKVRDIAPLYNQGSVEYDEKSEKWYKTINSESLAIANGEDLW